MSCDTLLLLLLLLLLHTHAARSGVFKAARPDCTQRRNVSATMKNACNVFCSAENRRRRTHNQVRRRFGGEAASTSTVGSLRSLIPAVRTVPACVGSIIISNSSIHCLSSAFWTPLLSIAAGHGFADSSMRLF
ncbi:hypothetical protein IWX50DRAFT_392197 [Phyllosticta citricarpa]|uniref:Secreted protein n=1 Tax=Phyllosticta citricarpa TaxID=55181 RepID=A0ABR1MNZ5_9PEZI